MTSFTIPQIQLLITIIIASKFCIYFDWNEIFLLLFMMKELFFLAFSICFRNIYNVFSELHLLGRMEIIFFFLCINIFSAWMSLLLLKKIKAFFSICLLKWFEF